MPAPPWQTTRSLLRRADIDANTDSIARTIRHLGHLAAAVVHVSHAVAVGALLPLVTVVRLATLHGVFLRRLGGVGGALYRLLVSDRGADHRTGRRRRVTTLAVTE